MSAEGTCRGCGARIFWKKTKAGKNMPVDPTASGGDPVGAIYDGAYMVSHYATCPKAADFRKSKEERQAAIAESKARRDRAWARQREKGGA